MEGLFWSAPAVPAPNVRAATLKAIAPKPRTPSFVDLWVTAADLLLPVAGDAEDGVVGVADDRGWERPRSVL